MLRPVYSKSIQNTSTAMQLKQLSELLDDYPQLVDLVALDLSSGCTSGRGANGLTGESVFRCLVLKQLLQVSYERLAFHLSDSDTCRTFARLENGGAIVLLHRT